MRWLCLILLPISAQAELFQERANLIGAARAYGTACPNLVFDWHIAYEQALGVGVAFVDLDGKSEFAVMSQSARERVARFIERSPVPLEERCSSALRRFGPSGTLAQGLLREV